MGGCLTKNCLIHGKAEVVPAVFGRNFPPEAQGARAGDGGFDPGALRIRDGAALGGINAVMGGRGLREPVGIAIGYEDEPRRVVKGGSKR